MGLQEAGVQPRLPFHLMSYTKVGWQEVSPVNSVSAIPIFHHEKAVVCSGFAVRSAFPPEIRKDVLWPQIRGPLHRTYRDNRHCSPE